MSDWNSAQYLKFKNERTQPSVDLIARIGLETPADIIDIGCGPGNSTEQLKLRYPSADIIGADNSPDMIKTAQMKYEDMKFILCDAANDLNSLGKKFDIVFSNACIQWIPEHEKLIPEMLSLLKPDGILAVQTPMNYNEPIHIIIDETVKSAKWRSKFPNPRIFHNLSPEGYFDLLSEHSSDFTMWETVYYHKMRSHSDIMEWYKGTGLRPYLNALSDAEKEEFEDDIFRRVEKAYPVQKNGEIIFRFPRLFFTAQKI